MIQAFIFFLSLFGFYLLSGKTARHWGFVASLCGQPFWMWSAWTTKAWGIGLLAIFYTILNIRGIYLHWPKK